jgi:hypothetical protein
LKASHFISYLDKNLFRVEILHVKSINWTGIKIIDSINGNLMATSHFIDQSQLPVETLIQNDEDKNNIIYVSKKNEKAMLVRNLNGDFSILKVNSSSDKDNDENYLEIIIYNMNNDNKKNLVKIIKDDFKLILNDQFSNISVDLTNGKIEFKILNNNFEEFYFESMLANIFSIVCLFIFSNPSSQMNISSVFLNSIGFNDLKEYGFLRKYPILELSNERNHIRRMRLAKGACDEWSWLSWCCSGESGGCGGGGCGGGGCGSGGCGGGGCGSGGCGGGGCGGGGCGGGGCGGGGSGG